MEFWDVFWQGSGDKFLSGKVRPSLSPTFELHPWPYAATRMLKILSGSSRAVLSHYLIPTP